MKKLIVLFTFVSITSCTTLQTDDERNARYYTADKKKNSLMMDLCSMENMPEPPDRPVLTSDDLRHLNDEQIDNKIKSHITALNKHIDAHERTLENTRRRVQLCR